MNKNDSSSFSSHQTKTSLIVFLTHLETGFIQPQQKQYNSSHLSWSGSGLVEINTSFTELDVKKYSGSTLSKTQVLWGNPVKQRGQEWQREAVENSPSLTSGSHSSTMTKNASEKNPAMHSAIHYYIRLIAQL